MQSKCLMKEYYYCLCLFFYLFLDMNYLHKTIVTVRIIVQFYINLLHKLICYVSKL